MRGLVAQRRAARSRCCREPAHTRNAGCERKNAAAGHDWGSREGRGVPDDEQLELAHKAGMMAGKAKVQVDWEPCHSGKAKS